MRAVKFGGSSVADAGRLRAAGAILARLRAHAPVTAVVSAMAGVTDGLLRVAADAQAGGARWMDDLRALGERHRQAYRALAGAAPGAFEAHWAEVEREAAALTAGGHRAEQAQMAARFSGWGERLAVGLLAAATGVEGAPAFALDEAPVMLGNCAHPDSMPEPSYLATRAWLLPRLAMPVTRGAIPVLPGYIARDASGRLTALGRNSSDHAAAVIAAALGAESLTLYSDVAGVYSADPRIAPDATLLPALTYDEAARIAARGAKALHPRAVEPLIVAGIPLLLRAASAPGAPGTDIGPRDWFGLHHPRAGAWVVSARPDGRGVTISAIRLPAWPDRGDSAGFAASAARDIVGRGLRPLTVARDELILTVAHEHADEAVRALSAALEEHRSHQTPSGLATGA